MGEDKFVTLVVRMRSCLESKFTAKDINDLESKHREFRRGICGEAMIKSIIDAQTDVMLLDEGWGGGINERFPLLCEFVGGLASAYSGTARVESDFYILSIKKNALPNVLGEPLARWHHAREAVHGVAGVGNCCSSF